MSDEDRRRWDQRYAEGAYTDRTHPSALLAELERELPRGRALDVACGAGRNAMFLAAHGHDVDAVDISAVALERAEAESVARGLRIRWIEADVEANPGSTLPRGPYDLIVLVRYVHRGIFGPLLARLAPGGVLLCEEHADSDEPVVGPRRPEHRMRPNELLHLALAAGGDGGLVRYYREGQATDPDGRRAALAQIVLVRGTHFS